jgi:hypothetical protein
MPIAVAVMTAKTGDKHYSPRRVSPTKMYVALNYQTRLSVSISKLGPIGLIGLIGL